MGTEEEEDTINGVGGDGRFILGVGGGGGGGNGRLDVLDESPRRGGGGGGGGIMMHTMSQYRPTGLQAWQYNALGAVTPLQCDEDEMGCCKIGYDMYLWWQKIKPYYEGAKIN